MGTFDFNKDAEILIYGYGKVGQDLHRRLVGQGYRVIGIIDKNAERFAPVDNCVFFKPEELDAESAGHIIVLTLQNILGHERVVKMLAAKGAEKKEVSQKRKFWVDRLKTTSGNALTMRQKRS